MRKIPVTGKDLHHPYSILVIFMVMMVLSAYTHKTDESHAESFSSDIVKEESTGQSNQLNLNKYLEHSKY